ncbi:hypothetical protein D3C78_1876500 [compost metagenome]
MVLANLDLDAALAQRLHGLIQDGAPDLLGLFQLNQLLLELNFPLLEFFLEL